MDVLANSSTLCADKANTINPKPKNMSPNPNLTAEFGFFFRLFRNVHNIENGMANSIINPALILLVPCRIHSN